MWRLGPKLIVKYYNISFFFMSSANLFSFQIYRSCPPFVTELHTDVITSNSIFFFFWSVQYGDFTFLLFFQFPQVCFSLVICNLIIFFHSFSDNRPDESFFSKLDSSLKKNTAFIRKLVECLSSTFSCLKLCFF